MTAARGNIAQVPAVILAGGLGTRLRVAVDGRPKVLAPVGGRPFLTYLLDRLEHAGIRRVVLCTGYLGDQVEAAFGGRYGAVSLAYSPEAEPLGTGGALRRAAPLLDGDPVLVLNGDSYCDVDLAVFLAWHRAHRGSGSLVLTRVPEVRRYGSVRLGPDSTILSFEEKPGDGVPTRDDGAAGRAGWVSAGIYLLSRVLIHCIDSDRPVSIERDVFPTWIPHGLYGYPRGGRFLDIGTPASYAEAVDFFAAVCDGSSRDESGFLSVASQTRRVAR